MLDPYLERSRNEHCRKSNRFLDNVSDFFADLTADLRLVDRHPLIVHENFASFPVMEI